MIARNLNKGLAVTATLLMLAACGPGDDTKTGKVVATVGDAKITTADVDSELAGSSLPPGAKAQAEQAALKRIIERKLMAQKAVKEGLEKAPDFEIRVQRARDSLLAAAAQRSQGEAKPDRAAADAYVQANPSAFANRKVLVIDQIRAPRSALATLEATKGSTSLDPVAAALDQAHVSYTRGLILFDSLTADPRIVERLSTIPAGEVFRTDQDGLVLTSQIVQTKSLPLTGDLAAQTAGEILAARQQQEALAKTLADLRAAIKITYEPGYGPAAK